MLVAARARAAGCGGGSKQTARDDDDRRRERLHCGLAAAAGRRADGTKPTTQLDPTKTYDVTFQTNCGSFTIRLAMKTSPDDDARRSPASSRSGFFDHTIFHRIVPGFVIQGGDPTGTGDGGPGYTTVDTPPAGDEVHPRHGRDGEDADRAGGSGRQPVLHRHRARTRGLPPDYAVLGQVVKGLRRRSTGSARSATPSRGQPTETVVIEHATLSSS